MGGKHVVVRLPSLVQMVELWIWAECWPLVRVRLDVAGEVRFVLFDPWAPFNLPRPQKQEYYIATSKPLPLEAVRLYEAEQGCYSFARYALPHPYVLRAGDSATIILESSQPK
jgi:hypothetical protein